MSQYFQGQTRGVLLRWQDGVSLRVLFQTESSNYTPQTGGVLGTASADCLLISEAEVRLYSAFVSHVWIASERSHKYKFAFDSDASMGPHILCGMLLFTFIDGSLATERAEWIQSTARPTDGPASCVSLNFEIDDSVSHVGRRAFEFGVAIPVKN